MPVVDEEAEDRLAPISALQHLVFCPRQCALIHLEGAWAENVLTAEGRLLHERADEAPGETRPGLRIARGVQLASRRLGLVGRADVVELRGGRGKPLRACPVEYKRGAPKVHDADRVQLCAQALCLEEMLGVTVAEGAIFYGRPRRRETVAMDAALRARTEAAAADLHALLRSGRTPPPKAGPWCGSCSLEGACLPNAVGGRSAAAWLARQLDRLDLDRADHRRPEGEGEA
jgi:CRISPR-associated exonuclease Cas4